MARSPCIRVAMTGQMSGGQLALVIQQLVAERNRCGPGVRIITAMLGIKVSTSIKLFVCCRVARFGVVFIVQTGTKWC